MPCLVVPLSSAEIHCSGSTYCAAVPEELHPDQAEQSAQSKTGTHNDANVISAEHRAAVVFVAVAQARWIGWFGAGHVRESRTLSLVQEELHRLNLAMHYWAWQ